MSQKEIIESIFNDDQGLDFRGIKFHDFMLCRIGYFANLKAHLFDRDFCDKYFNFSPFSIYTFKLWLHGMQKVLNIHDMRYIYYAKELHRLSTLINCDLYNWVILCIRQQFMKSEYFMVIYSSFAYIKQLMRTKKINIVDYGIDIKLIEKTVLKRYIPNNHSNPKADEFRELIDNVTRSSLSWSENWTQILFKWFDNNSWPLSIPELDLTDAQDCSYIWVKYLRHRHSNPLENIPANRVKYYLAKCIQKGYHHRPDTQKAFEMFRELYKSEPTDTDFAHEYGSAVLLGIGCVSDIKLGLEILENNWDKNRNLSSGSISFIMRKYINFLLDKHKINEDTLLTDNIEQKSDPNFPGQKSKVFEMDSLYLVLKPRYWEPIKDCQKFNMPGNLLRGYELFNPCVILFERLLNKKLSKKENIKDVSYITTLTCEKMKAELEFNTEYKLEPKLFPNETEALSIVPYFPQVIHYYESIDKLVNIDNTSSKQYTFSRKIYMHDLEKHPKIFRSTFIIRYFLNSIKRNLLIRMNAFDPHILETLVSGYDLLGMDFYSVEILVALLANLINTIPNTIYLVLYLLLIREAYHDSPEALDCIAEASYTSGVFILKEVSLTVLFRKTIDLKNDIKEGLLVYKAITKKLCKNVCRALKIFNKITKISKDLKYTIKNVHKACKEKNLDPVSAIESCWTKNNYVIQKDVAKNTYSINREFEKMLEVHTIIY